MLHRLPPRAAETLEQSRGPLDGDPSCRPLQDLLLHLCRLHWHICCCWGASEHSAAAGQRPWAPVCRWMHCDAGSPLDLHRRWKDRLHCSVDEKEVVLLLLLNLKRREEEGGEAVPSKLQRSSLQSSAEMQHWCENRPPPSLSPRDMLSRDVCCLHYRCCYCSGGGKERWSLENRHVYLLQQKSELTLLDHLCPRQPILDRPWVQC